MSEQSISDIISSISESVDSASLSLDKLKEFISNDSHPALIEQLLKETESELPEGVSLLSLKNSSMLSYLNNLVLVILSNIERLESDNEEEINTKRLEAIKNSIVQRVTMERGVKGLENRLNYQLDKMTKAYDRMVEEDEKSSVVKHVENADNDDDSEEDSEAEDISSYRPDASSLAASLKAKKQKEEAKSSSSKSSKSTEVYKPPRITPVLPPSAITGESSNKTTKTRKLQSMEEFLREQGDAPIAEESIGSTILQHGRGGIKTSRDKQKEEEIQRYEESNFVRLNEQQVSGKKKRSRQDLNVFGGEDFGMFNNKDRDINDSASRKKKSMSAWDRAKRKRL